MHTACSQAVHICGLCSVTVYLHLDAHLELLGEVKEVDILRAPHPDVPGAHLCWIATCLAGAGVAQGDCHIIRQQVVHHNGRVEPQHILRQALILLAGGCAFLARHLHEALLLPKTEEAVTCACGSEGRS